MSKLFEEFSINNLKLRNRFVLSAAADNLERKSEEKIKRFSKLAQGNIGLIISGALTINEIPGWEPIIKSVHNQGGKIALQIMFRGGPGVMPGSESDDDRIAVSELPQNSVYFHSFIKYGKHHAATEDELEQIIDIYANTAQKAKQLGADAVQIHSAHQNFLCQFLSPITNKRTDNWGGSIENRTRIHREIIKAIRNKVGHDFPVLIKLGVEDGFDNGLKFNEGKQAAEIIAKSDFDALEISQGLQNLNNWNRTSMRIVKDIKEEGYFRIWCKEIKKVITKPTIMTGGLRSYKLIEEIVNNKETDLIGMCRPFIREPDLVSRWQKGDTGKAKCISCNKCVTELLIKGLPLECYLDKA